jgi:hypothetical protein
MRDESQASLSCVGYLIRMLRSVAWVSASEMSERDATKIRYDELLWQREIYVSVKLRQVAVNCCDMRQDISCV